MTAPESAQVGGPNLKATHRNVDALSKVRKNWYVYFRDGAFTFARYANKSLKTGHLSLRLTIFSSNFSPYFPPDFPVQFSPIHFHFRQQPVTDRPHVRCCKLGAATRCQLGHLTGSLDMPLDKPLLEPLDEPLNGGPKGRKTSATSKTC